MSETTSPGTARFDAERLLTLLPALYRIRDAEQGGPLRALLAVLAEQIGAVEESLEQLYDDQFVETCAGWAVPYIGDLVGYRALHLGFADGSKVELMEPLPGSTFLDSFFRRTGGGGLHHITFKVPDMGRALRRLQDLGYSPTGLHLDDPYWQEAFLHPKHAHGTLVQIAHAPQPFPVAEGLTINDVLSGRGEQGTGVASP